ncbi:MAG: 3-phosphoshikimate 1-carboxyvinyltransferase [bacterium]|nr:3-phosphoshikimate 1-carboxyvinyltransferase [bacterium]
METLTINQITHAISGEISVPGDKSISHRAIMFSAISEGTTTITGFLNSEDCLCTATAFQTMGIEIAGLGTDRVIVQGKGLFGLEEPMQVLNAGNSGTTMRLILGILAGQDFFAVLTGDQYLCQRPMKRVIEPLTKMGAKIYGRNNNNYPPLSIHGGNLRAIDYKLPIASAQVKSALLLAGLYANGTTTITEPAASRDHTERMLRYLGVEVTIAGLTCIIQGGQKLVAKDLSVPGDISSAAFFIAAGLLIPDSKLVIKNVGINPTRTGLLHVLKEMGAYIQLENQHEDGPEPVADIVVQWSQLYGTEIGGTIIPTLIDEIPILAVLATQAEGRTVIRDAAELRVKETDRIHAVVSELTRFGAKIEEQDDGMIIYGPTALTGTTCHSFGDHRIAMSLAIAGLIARGTTSVSDTECINTSFPTFTQLLSQLTNQPKL